MGARVGVGFGGRVRRVTSISFGEVVERVETAGALLVLCALGRIVHRARLPVQIHYGEAGYQVHYGRSNVTAVAALWVGLIAQKSGPTGDYDRC